MKKNHLAKCYLLSCTLLIMAPTSYADDSDGTPGSNNDPSNVLTTIENYLQNLGMYFGYDVTNYCTSGSTCSQSSGSFSNALLESQPNPIPSTGLQTQYNAVTSFLSALLPSAPSAAQSVLVPTSNGLTGLSSFASWISPFANSSFTTKQTNPYPGPNTNSNSFSVLPNIDQVNTTGSTAYQQDPVNQAILNILTTPDVSFCMDGSGQPISSCSFPTLSSNNATGTESSNTVSTVSNFPLTQVQVMLNELSASFPTKDSSSSTSPQEPLQYALPSTNANIVPQLNSDTLLGPLIFDNNTNAGQNNSNNNQSAQGGMPANTPIQQAQNFIRYATGAATPLTQPNALALQTTYLTATAQGTTPPTLGQQLLAQATIANYIANLRVYAAQTSVGISNLYYILSKRMPVSPTPGGTPTSQALSEFMMATWRLTPQPAPGSSNSSTPNSWISQINTASSATVEKEIAILLAEINYQLYLSRTQQERMLLTESTLLLQSSHNAQPKSDLSRPPVASNNTSQATPQ